MGCTIFYKGTLRDSVTPESVFDCVSELIEQIDCYLQRESQTMTVYFNKGTSEPLVFSFINNRINEFCKWNGDTSEEFYSILDMFIKIKPLFKSLRVEDDDGIWYSYLARNRACKIRLRLLESDKEQQLLRRTFTNLTVPPNDLEALLLEQLGLRPFKPSFLRIIIQDFNKIMNYQVPCDFNAETIVIRASTLGFSDHQDINANIRNFKFIFPYIFLRIWLSYAFIYKTYGSVYKIPEETRGLKTSKIAALSGTLSIYLNLHSGGASNAKEAEMIKLAAKYYPTGFMGEVVVTDEPKRELELFFSMMDYIGFRYIGV
jgi:hypothetical protein